MLIIIERRRRERERPLNVCVCHSRRIGGERQEEKAAVDALAHCDGRLTSDVCLLFVRRERERRRRKKEEDEEGRNRKAYENLRTKRKNRNIDRTDITATYVRIIITLKRMPSFKERFRPSRKYKKAKEAGTLSANTDEPASGLPTNTTIASNIAGMLSPVLAVVASSSLSTMATTTVVSTADEHADRALFSMHHSHYPIDQCECEMRECDTLIRRYRKMQNDAFFRSLTTSAFPSKCSEKRLFYI